MRRLALCALVALHLFATPAYATFSIIARDPATGEMGIAVASRVLAVRWNGSIAEADVGVVARQADLDFTAGRRAIEMLRAGTSAPEVLERLRAQLSPMHQLAVMDRKGSIVASTGPKALPWNGHKVGANYSVQGNVLVGPKVLDAMAAAFEGLKAPLRSVCLQL